MATAKKPEPTPVVPEVEAPKKKPGRFLTIGLIALSVVAVFLLVTILYIAGALSRPEEAIYSHAKSDLMKAVLKPLHHPKFTAIKTPEEALNIAILQKNIAQADNNLTDQKAMTDAQLKVKDDQIRKLQKDIGDMKTQLKAVQEGTAQMPAATVPGAAPAAPAMVTSAALPAPANATTLQFTRALAAKDYRKASKIIDAMATDQAVEILNVLPDQNDVVEIIVLLQDKRAGEIIAALGPAKGADLIKKILDRRGGA